MSNMCGIEPLLFHGGAQPARWHNPVGVDLNLHPFYPGLRVTRNPGLEDDDEDEHEHDWGASNAEFGVPPSLDSGAARQSAEWFPERRARSDAPYLRAWGWSEIS